MTGQILRDVPEAEYHRRSLDVASASGLKLIASRSPAHFCHYVNEPEDDRETPALRFGRAFHCATLTPDVFASTYAVLPPDAPSRPTQRQIEAKKPSDSTLAQIAWWDEWNASNAGRTMLTAADYDKAQRMADSARAHPVAAGLLTGGQREVTFRWQDDKTGIQCKARADLYESGQFLMDLKSCRDASPEGFARAVVSYMYGLQAMHYLSGVQAAGESIRWFVFLAVESEPPYVCQPYILDSMAEELGWKQRERAITTQARCLQDGRWPGYSERLEQLTLPAYAFFREDDDSTQPQDQP